ncbi:MAG: LysM peptidoglycan-binding domain-containing protein [Bacteroidia bacterium]|nr:LysM peptidoglycan-binding domain-containing protein [Bacteroidia bacterium]
MIQHILDWVQSKRNTLAVALCALCTSAFAQEYVTENGVTYKIYTVQQSEGPWRVSYNHGITQEELFSANPELRETGLMEGMRVRIPVKDVSSINTSSSATSSPYAFYTVKQEDNATQISKRYGISLTDFYALNPECINGVKIGQVVKVPTTIVTTAQYLTYKVQFGETATKIAKRFGVTTQDIQNANPVVNVNALQAETLIRIPLSTLPAEDEYFYYHRIAAGEVLLSLSQKYDVLVEKIIERNPDIDPRSLSIGQIVVIDKKFEKKQDIMHEVERKETAWSISTKYGVKYDDLVAANPDIDLSSIKKGMMVRVPQFPANREAVPATDTYIVSNASAVDSTELYDYKKLGSPVINVALMLPFDADLEMRQMNEQGANYEKSKYTFRTKPYIEFYEGVKLALDTLASQGVRIKLNVMDVTNRLDAQNKLQSIKNSGVKPDLIIGPAHSDEIHDVALYARDNKVPVVLPFVQSDSLLTEVPYLFQASNVDTITTKVISHRMVEYCEGKNVIILSNISRTKSDIFRLRCVQDLCKQKGIEPVLHIFDTHEPHKFLDVISPDKENVLLLTSNEEAKAGSILSAIANVLDQKPGVNIRLVCTGDWLRYESVKVEVYHKLNTVIFSTYALDYSDLNTLRVLSKYRNQYFAEPVAFSPYFEKIRNQSGFSRYALWGYDIASLFVGARVQYGPDFFRRINDYKVNYTQSNFHFSHVTSWGGAVNTGVRTIEFSQNGKISVTDLY